MSRVRNADRPALAAACARVTSPHAQKKGPMGNYCVRGGLDPRSGWYITETVIYHQSKLTRHGPPGSASHKRIAAPPPDRMTSPST